MRTLTDRQAEVLHVIRESIRTRGYAPTLREIGATLGIRSTNGVNDHLRALERKGVIARDDWKSRAIRVVGDPSPSAPASAEAPQHITSEELSALRTFDERLARIASITGEQPWHLLVRLVEDEEERLRINAREAS